MYISYNSFRCGLVYHAPTGCEMIKKWLTKCADDSETANYISANTKDVSTLIFVVIFTNIYDAFDLELAFS